MKKVIVLVVLMVGVTGCAAQLNTNREYASLSGSPEGIRSILDGFNSAITNGKASPDKTTAAWQMRNKQEKELTKREMTPSFLASIFARNGASNVTNVDTSEGNEIE